MCSNSGHEAWYSLLQGHARITGALTRLALLKLCQTWRLVVMWPM